MAFDFSQYDHTKPQSMGDLPTGITKDDASQMWSLRSAPIDDPDARRNTDSEGNDMGSFKDLNPDAYKDQKTQYDEQQKLISAGMLTSAQKQGDSAGTYSYFGDAVPKEFSGHNDYHGLQGTALGESTRLTNTDHLPDGNQGLRDSAQVYDDPNWGKLTMEGNVKKTTPGADLFWKVAPILPSLFAGGIGLLAGGLTAAGGATAGTLIGDQTASSIGGGALGGSTATAGDILSNLPSWLTQKFPSLVKSGISNLNSKKPSLLSLGMQGAGAIPGVSDYMPLAQTGISLASGGGFDWTKFIPMALQAAKGH